MVRDDIIAYTI